MRYADLAPIRFRTFGGKLEPAQTPGNGHLIVRLGLPFASKRSPKPRTKRCNMRETPVYFDPETVAILRETLDDAWASLGPDQQAAMQKTALAERMLKSAAQGDVIVSVCLTPR